MAGRRRQFSFSLSRFFPADAVNMPHKAVPPIFSGRAPALIMNFDFSPFFAQYEALAAETDAVFAKVGAAHPDCVACKPGCSDCCHALFDLSFIEALYLNTQFLQAHPYGPARSAVLSSAADADRQLTRLKKGYFRTLRDGGDMDAIMEEAARARVRCPLLLRNNSCGLYEKRPITCRLYGIPAAIGGKSHVCGKSGFAKGQGYPTVRLEKIQERLDGISLELQKALGSRYSELYTVYVPLSMALLTNYDETYLGVGPAPKEDRS